MTDPAFTSDPDGLALALTILLEQRRAGGLAAPDLPNHLPANGLGELAALRRLAPLVLDRAANLGAPTAFAHMDPPTPWITWALSLWTASKNQNLLHPDTAPEARVMEQRVIDWLAPVFGMNGGHMTPGSTVANLTALWAAREARAINTVIASSAAHLSVKKAAHLLALKYAEIPAQADGAMDLAALPNDLNRACLVLTAGTTSAGAVDCLTGETGARWTHVDAAWAGPLLFSDAHASVLDGIERADSIAVSAHKWLFQPKESALILFKNADEAHGAITFGGSYLAAPNIGVLGSHGASAAPLLATLLAFGQSGLAERIDRCMAAANALADAVSALPELDLWGPPATGVVVWRHRNDDANERLFAHLPRGSVSRTIIDSRSWFRNVAANPNVDVAAQVDALKAAVHQVS